RGRGPRAAGPAPRRRGAGSRTSGVPCRPASRCRHCLPEIRCEEASMEPLPRGAQFIRAKMLWEIALGVAGDISIPYYGNRDIKIDVGNASGEHYKPYLRMSVGSPVLAHAVVRE